MRSALRGNAIVEGTDGAASTIRSLTAPFSAKKFFSSSLPAARERMLSAAMEETRNALRSAALKRRAALDPETCRSWSSLIQAKILDLPQYRAARSVAIYRAMGNEVDTGTIIEHSLGHNQKVFVPKLDWEKPGVFVQILSNEEQRRGLPGTVASAGAAELSRAASDNLLVIVPGVLFDYRGNRLGRGGGWYDRALRSLGACGVYVGLAFEFQLVDRVPAQPWDERVHYVITESRVIDCGERLQGQVTR
jgi:5-formyltetrahydrofolate cyclo-ligase